MRKTKVGILTFSDGRDYIHKSLLELNRRYQKSLADALVATGEVEVVAGERIIWNNVTAREEGQRLAQAGCDLTICDYAIWCYPHLTALATACGVGLMGTAAWLLARAAQHPSIAALQVAIVGVGATRRLSAVKWGVAGRIVWAWVLTIPAAGAIGAGTYWLLRAFGLG